MDRRLFQKNLISGESEHPCFIYSLSPSDAAIYASKLSFGKFLPEIKSPKRVLVPSGPNYTAIVLLISVGDFHIMLGSDLVNAREDGTGWEIICSNYKFKEQMASFFKIPHHGSENAHHDEVWEKLLRKEPITVITPFQSGSVNLPTEEDLGRILNLSGNSFITGPLKEESQRNESIQ